MTITSTANTLQRRSEILPFTGLRGLAAWVVALYHFRVEAPDILPLGGVIGNGEYAVDVFFIMSGYVLMASYGAQFGLQSTASTYLRFIGYRLGRIYPAHIAVLLAYLAIPAAYLVTNRPLPLDRFTGDYFLASVLLVQNWGLFPTLGWNIPAWTISAEFLFYLSFPMMARGLLLCSSRAAWLVLLAAALLGMLAAAGWYKGLLVADIPGLGPARCLLECALGAWLFVAADRAQVPRSGSLLLQALSALFLVLFVLHLLPDYAALPASAVCLLWSLLDAGNPLSRVLSSPLSLALGRLSFATYIVHYLIKDVVKLTMVGSASQLATTVTYVTAVLLASIVIHHAIERPAQLVVRGWVGGLLKA